MAQKNISKYSKDQIKDNKKTTTTTATPKYITLRKKLEMPKPKPKDEPVKKPIRSDLLKTKTTTVPPAQPAKKKIETKPVVLRKESTTAGIPIESKMKTSKSYGIFKSKLKARLIQSRESNDARKLNKTNESIDKFNFSLNDSDDSDYDNTIDDSLNVTAVPAQLLKKGLPYVEIRRVHTSGSKKLSIPQVMAKVHPIKKIPKTTMSAPPRIIQHTNTRGRVATGDDLLVRHAAKQIIQHRYGLKKSLSVQTDPMDLLKLPQHEYETLKIASTQTTPPVTEMPPKHTPSVLDKNDAKQPPNVLDKSEIKEPPKSAVNQETANLPVELNQPTEMKKGEISFRLDKDDINETMKNLACAPKCEFERNFQEWMERDEISKGLQAQLRTDLIHKFNQTKLGRLMHASNSTFTNKYQSATPMQTLTLTPFTLALYTIVAEFLLTENCHFTLSVFYTEAPVSNTLPNFEQRANFRFMQQEISDLLQALTGTTQPELTTQLYNAYVESKRSLLFSLMRFMLQHYIHEIARSKDMITKMTGTDPQDSIECYKTKTKQTSVATETAASTIVHNKATNTLQSVSLDTQTQLSAMKKELENINYDSHRHLLSLMKRVRNSHKFSQAAKGRHSQQKAFVRMWEQLEKNVAQYECVGLDSLRLTVKNLCQCTRTMEELLKLKMPVEDTNDNQLKLDAAIQTRETYLGQPNPHIRHETVQTVPMCVHSVYTATNPQPRTKENAMQTDECGTEQPKHEEEKSYEQWVTEMCDTKSGIRFMERLEHSVRKALSVQKSRYAKIYEIKMRHERELIKIRYKRKSMERICRHAAAETSGEVRLLIDQMGKQIAEYESCHAALLEKIHATEVAANANVQTLQPLQQQLLQAVLPTKLQSKIIQMTGGKTQHAPKKPTKQPEELEVERAVQKAKLRIQELENEGNELEKNFLDSLACTRLQREAEYRQDFNRERKLMQETIAQCRQLQERHQLRFNNLAHIEKAFANDLRKFKLNEKQLEAQLLLPKPKPKPKPPHKKSVANATATAPKPGYRNAITEAKHEFFKDRVILKQYVTDEANKYNQNTKFYNTKWRAKDFDVWNTNENTAANTGNILDILNAPQYQTHLPQDHNNGLEYLTTTTTTTITSATKQTTSSTEDTQVKKLLKRAYAALPYDACKPLDLSLSSKSSTCSSTDEEDFQQQIDKRIAKKRANPLAGTINDKLQRSFTKMQQLFSNENVHHTNVGTQCPQIAENEPQQSIQDNDRQMPAYTAEFELAEPSSSNIRSFFESQDTSSSSNSDESFWQNLNKLVN